MTTIQNRSINAVDVYHEHYGTYSDSTKPQKEVGMLYTLMERSRGNVDKALYQAVVEYIRNGDLDYLWVQDSKGNELFRTPTGALPYNELYGLTQARMNLMRYVCTEIAVRPLEVDYMGDKVLFHCDPMFLRSDGALVSHELRMQNIKTGYFDAVHRSLFWQLALLQTGASYVEHHIHCATQITFEDKMTKDEADMAFDDLFYKDKPSLVTKYTVDTYTPTLRCKLYPYEGMEAHVHEQIDLFLEWLYANQKQTAA